MTYHITLRHLSAKRGKRIGITAFGIIANLAVLSNCTLGINTNPESIPIPEDLSTVADTRTDYCRAYQELAIKDPNAVMVVGDDYATYLAGSNSLQPIAPDELADAYQYLVDGAATLAETSDLSAVPIDFFTAQERIITYHIETCEQ